MMINKRLIRTVPESITYIKKNVALQWCALVANLVMMTCITSYLAALFVGRAGGRRAAITLVVSLVCIAVRFVCAILSAKMAHHSSASVKKTLRTMMYQKLLRLGAAYQETVKTSEVVQVLVEGVDQLETYFGAYLPQFFYAMLAPITLFVYLCFVDVWAAVVLLICVPMIPIAIAAVQTWAKKLLSKYWGQYTALGDSFLENLQGLTTLKIYQADERKQQEMNEEAEKFRKITMRVLTMQLNSITIMDLIAYGGAALGMIVAVTRFQQGQLTLAGCLLVIVVSADFFIPMRQLGSFFHIAMNGMAATEKMFRLLDLEEGSEVGCVPMPKNTKIVGSKVRYSYEADREILQGIDFEIAEGGFTAIVGESGCGKSTTAALLMGRQRGYEGSITIGGVELSDICERSLNESITYIGHQSYLFQGTVRENLLMGNPNATDEQLWAVLERMNLAEFLRSEQGLDTVLLEKAANLSGGQCQRLALARAILHDSPIYIFDEATSNIDVESENAIMQEIHELAKSKTVMVISHRLANVKDADRIYVLDAGQIVESGTQDELVKLQGTYARLWYAQQSLEQFGETQSQDVLEGSV
jgi:ABC-type transport system involved in cytochrome bd biosynthesis fused ATPase/permease subunit